MMLIIASGDLVFRARFEEALAAHTVAAVRSILPLESKLLHVRWSGEAGRVPLGDLFEGGAAGREPFRDGGRGRRRAA